MDTYRVGIGLAVLIVCVGVLCLWIGYRMGRRESCRIWASLGGFWLRGREGAEHYDVTKSGRYSRTRNQHAEANSIWKS